MKLKPLTLTKKESWVVERAEKVETGKIAKVTVKVELNGLELSTVKRKRRRGRGDELKKGQL
jgi:translation elongation factor P/translation initiation factor 5A